MTFAGTPDRVESRLVPEAGFPLDTFPVSGLPRTPSAAQLRAAWRASAAPSHCLRILARRRPQVVLGAGGFVAGPMVLAARLRRIPAALTEADAHLGLANRLAAPFARRLFLAYDIPGRRGAKTRVVGRPIPRAHRDVSREDGRTRFGFSGDAPVVGRLRRLGRRTLLERARRRGVGRRRAAGPPHRRRARLPRAPSAGQPRRLRPPRAHGALRRRARRGRPRGLPGRRDGVGARRGGDALGARPVPPRDGRPPDAERAPLRAGRGRRRRGRRRARPRARDSSTASCPTRSGSRRCAGRCSRSPDPTLPT